MRELANRNVHDLSLFDDYVRIADESRYGAPHDYIERMTDDDPATSSLIDMADGNTGIWATMRYLTGYVGIC